MNCKEKFGIGLFIFLTLTIFALSINSFATSYGDTYSLSAGSFNSNLYTVQNSDSTWKMSCKFNKGGALSADSASTALNNVKDMRYTHARVAMYNNNDERYKEAEGALSASVSGNLWTATLSTSHYVVVTSTNGYGDSMHVEGIK